MRYERFAPRPELAAYVDHFWIIETDLGSLRHEEILVPNGRPTLLLSVGDTGWRKDPQSGDTQPNQSGLTGIGTRPVIIGQTGKVQLIAAQLAPFGPQAFNLPPAIDQHLTLNATFDALSGECQSLGVCEASARHLEQAMAARLSRYSPEKLRGLVETYALLDSGQPADVEAWAKMAGMSYDQLYRLFKSLVGISPKIALMIARYQAHIGSLLADERGGGLAQLALLQGYFDQAHANREFRRFTGVSPRQFRQTLNGIAKMMHQPPQSPDLSKNSPNRVDSLLKVQTGRHSMTGIVHFEITADDVNAASAFYVQALGLSSSPSPFLPGYIILSEQAQAVGAVMDRKYQSQRVIIWFAVDNLDTALSRIQHAGGKQVGDINTIPGEGKVVYASAPDGSVFGLKQAETV